MAQAFVDYMATQGVILTIQQHQQTDVWLADESRAERVHAELARFLENPGDPRYLAASWQSGQTDSGLRYQRYPFLATLRERAGPVTRVGDGRVCAGLYRDERAGRPCGDALAGMAV